MRPGGFSLTYDFFQKARLARLRPMAIALGYAGHSEHFLDINF